MTNSIKTRLSLDEAIEKGNINEINEILDDIDINDEPDMSLEDLINKCESEEKVMKKKVSFKILVAAASMAVIATVSVGAAALLKTYSFSDGDNYVSVTSNGNLSEDEAKALADDALDANPVPDANNTITPDKFKTVEEAEKKYDMQVVIPDKMPALKLSEVTGTQTYIDSESGESTIWATYGDINKKAFGMTITKYDYNGNDITNVMKSDAQPDGEGYTSDKGYKFEVLKEIDEESGRTAKIYSTTVGNYNYSMVFANFDNSEIEEVVNSVDLENYK